MTPKFREGYTRSVGNSQAVPLGEVLILSRVLAIAFDVVSLDKGLNSTLEVRIACWEAELLVQLSHETVVVQDLACFHGAHDNSIHLV